MTLAALGSMTSLVQQCGELAVPTLCYTVFPLCDSEQPRPRRLCRDECELLQNDICRREYTAARKQLAQGIKYNTLFKNIKIFYCKLIIAMI